jgi:hypothetical protein
MNFDDQLPQAFKGEVPLAAAPDLARRVRQRRWRHRAVRTLEVLLTLAALAVFVPALVSGGMTTTHWLLMPFYVVFLPTVWVIALRMPGRHADATRSGAIYAQLRMAQLRTGLRDLWMARAAAWALLWYSVLANLGVWVFGAAHWRADGLVLLLVAVGWLAGTLWLSATLRQRRLREYRAVRRLA